jgi:hypothetical protein
MRLIGLSSSNGKGQHHGSIVWLVLVGCLGVLPGCAGQQDFQQTARVTLGQTTELESEVNGKAAAENAYTETMIGIFQASASRESFIARQVILNQKRDTFTAQVMKSAGKTQRSEVGDFANGVITAAVADRKATDSLQKAYAVALPANIAAIDAQTASLAPVTKDLMQLQADQSTADELKTWIAFGSQLKDKYQSSSVTKQ